MNVFDLYQTHVKAALHALAATGSLPADLPTERVSVEPSRDPAHGDLATNAALILAKPAKMAPMVVAEALAGSLKALPGVADAVPAKPGFVNLTLYSSEYHAVVRAALLEGDRFGLVDLGKGEPINVEYCSANPTGPLHVGHGRGTVFGDALAGLLAAVGYDVTREYYVNDGGAQVDLLARSVHHRYLEALGAEPEPMFEGGYPGDYLVPVAQALIERDGELWRHVPEAEWLSPIRTFAVEAMLAVIKSDLAALGVEFAVFTHEAQLIADNKVAACIDELERLDLVYTGVLEPPKGKPVDDWEPRPQLLFRATRFGDDVDRPLQRSNGAWTYFANDIANHFDKFRRGFAEMIDVWGADHGGYVKRMQSGVRGITDNKGRLEIKLCQLVQLMDGGQPLKMSKRAGRIVTLRDVIDEVGADVFRFMMLTRKNDAPLQFDLAKAVEQSKDNPVFYVQYAHARICSVFRRAGDAEEGSSAIAAIEPAALVDAPLDRLNDPAELDVMRQLALYPRTVAQAAEHREPHRIAFFLQDLAGAVHRLWTRGKEDARLRVVVADDAELTRARLALLHAARHVLASGLRLLGVRPVDELH